MDDSTTFKQDVLYFYLTEYPQGLDGRGWDISSLSENPYLPPRFVLENQHLPWDWSKIAYNIHLNSELIDLLIDDYATKISSNSSLPVEVWEQFGDKLDWEEFGVSGINLEMLIRLGGTVEEVLQGKSRVNWNYISSNLFLTTDIVEYYEQIWDSDWFRDTYTIRGWGDRNGWDNISDNIGLNISLGFVKKYPNKLNYHKLVHNHDMDCDILEFMFHNSQTCDWNHLPLLKYQDVINMIPRLEVECKLNPDDYKLNEFKDSMHRLVSRLRANQFIPPLEDYLSGNVEYNPSREWDLLSNTDLDLETMSKLASKLNWIIMSSSKYVKLDSIRIFACKWDWEVLSSNVKITADFIISNPDLPWNRSSLSRRCYDLPSDRFIKNARSKIEL